MFSLEQRPEQRGDIENDYCCQTTKQGKIAERRQNLKYGNCLENIEGTGESHCLDQVRDFLKIKIHKKKATLRNLYKKKHFSFRRIN